MCDRFKCLPSALLAEDMELMRMIEIEAMMSLSDEGSDDGV